MITDAFQSFSKIWLLPVFAVSVDLFPSTAKVMFNNNGRVEDFRNTNSGNVWSQGEGMGGSRFSNW